MSERHKFQIRLPDGSVYKPPQKTMVVMNTGGVIFLATDCNYSGWYIRKLSDVVPKYDVVIKT